MAERAIGVEAPVREHSLVTDVDTAEESRLRTEIGRPVFRIGSALTAGKPEHFKS